MRGSDLTFPLMTPHTFSVSHAANGAPPLTFPKEVWEEMPPEYQQACQSAQALLEGFHDDRTLGLREARKRAGLGLDEALQGLEVLDGMELVRVESSDAGPSVTLLAVPEDHVRITGPDGKVRWVFVARPLDEPEVPESALN
jgi:hypothetical protein